MKLKIIIIFIFFLFTSNAQNGWFFQQPTTKSDLNTVVFPNVNIGYCIGFGYSGTILKTTNGGDDWNVLPTGVNYDLYSGSFPDVNNGYAIDLYGRILKTTNGGSSWEPKYLPTSLESYDVFFIDSLTGWIVGYDNLIFKTSDGGNNWMQQSPGIISTFLHSVYFINKNTGFIAGQYGVILKTTNSGQSWSLKHSNYFNVRLESIFFPDEYTGYTVGYDINHGFKTVIYKSIDKGESWFELSISTQYNITDIYFTDSVTGYGVEGYFIIKTTDGGYSWLPQYSGNSLLTSVFFVATNIGYVVGYNGTILKTTNGGLSFIEDQPNDFLLFQNYPNPFNSTTKIKYRIPSSTGSPLLGGARGGSVMLKVYDILGREVAALVNQEKPAGEYEVEFNASNLSSGIYFYQLKAGSYSSIKKMIYLK